MSTTVLYTFNEYSLTVSVVVKTAIGTFNAVNNNQYPGYAILGGSVSFEFNGNKQNILIPPQTVANLNVLWAASGAGSGGSSYGIDTYGITVAGDAGTISFDPAAGTQGFFINTHGLNSKITLAKVLNWPPKA